MMYPLAGYGRPEEIRGDRQCDLSANRLNAMTSSVFILFY